MNNIFVKNTFLTNFLMEDVVGEEYDGSNIRVTISDFVNFLEYAKDFIHQDYKKCFIRTTELMTKFYGFTEQRNINQLLKFDK